MHRTAIAILAVPFVLTAYAAPARAGHTDPALRAAKEAALPSGVLPAWETAAERAAPVRPAPTADAFVFSTYRSERADTLAELSVKLTSLPVVSVVPPAMERAVPVVNAELTRLTTVPVVAPVVSVTRPEPVYAAVADRQRCECATWCR